MHDPEEEDHRPLPHPAAPAAPAPFLRLAGIDEDDTGEPHVVRGID